MTTLLFIAAAWFVLSIPCALVIGRYLAHRTPPAATGTGKVPSPRRRGAHV